MHAIVSVHDVMPHTLPAITQVITRLQPYPAAKICLLVVPGRPWQPAQLDQLRRWQAAGYELAAHGWRHETTRIESLYHKLHSRFVSRSVAEHLSLSPAEIDRLIRRNHAWWAAHGFDSPQLYVPPAWAMGALSTPALRTLPFRYFEHTGGLVDGQHGVTKRLPLAGFEADTAWRTPVLRLFNRVNRLVCSANRPLRISLHPYDFEHKLGHTIVDWLDRITCWVDYRAVFP